MQGINEDETQDYRSGADGNEAVARKEIQRHRKKAMKNGLARLVRDYVILISLPNIFTTLNLIVKQSMVANRGRK